MSLRRNISTQRPRSGGSRLWFVDWRVALLALTMLPLFLATASSGDSPHLPAGSQAHILYALLSGAFFIVLIGWSFQERLANIAKPFAVRLLIGGFVGGFFWTALHWCGARARDGLQVQGGSAESLLWGVVGWIGEAYEVLDRPGGGLSAQLFAFIVGVGISEEAAKALVTYITPPGTPDNHPTASAGFITGVGFGVVEGIEYSLRFYNGSSGWEIYLIRFVSCTALHGCWTAIAIVLLRLVDDEEHDAVGWLLRGLCLLPSALLHGLYDVFVDRTGALTMAVTLASFAGLCGLTTFARHRSGNPSGPLPGDWT